MYTYSIKTASEIIRKKRRLQYIAYVLKRGGGGGGGGGGSIRTDLELYSLDVALQLQNTQLFIHNEI